MYHTGTQIYILYNYELYKSIIKIYVYKYVLYFCNYNKNLYNKFEFLKN